jgi:hypothetical protein
MTGEERERNQRVQKVRRELVRYEHPLFVFDARPSGDGVELEIRCRFDDAAIHIYLLQFHPREIDNAQFPWMFQKQLYDGLHDYVIEMFTSNPQRQD